MTWHFIPANSPHFGGLWEAGVLKHHLKRIAANSALSFNELYTLLVQVETILNSRPINAMSNDVSDLDVLTPGHFLIGGPLTSLPELSLTDVRSNLLSRWQHLEKLRQQFWNRWQKEYLVRLQGRTKWMLSEGTAPNVGQLVIISDNNLPPLKWRMGRILEIHPGTDGVVRVATVKTNSGEVKRAVTRLCVLPIE